MDAIAQFLHELRSRFDADDGDNGGLATLLALEATLPHLDGSLKNETTSFHGCQSRIWLILDHDREQDVLRISADSDARIVRGLLAVAVGLYDRRSPTQIAAFPPTLLQDAGVLAFLAPNRANGFHRVLLHIHRTASSLAHGTLTTGQGAET